MIKSSLNKGVRMCKKCGEIVHENSLYDYCPSCRKIIEEVFDKIRDYLKEYPGATAYEMHQRLGIPIHVINNFVREGRLIEIPNQYLNVNCLRCGCLLLSAHHKYCPICEGEIYKEIDKAKQSLNLSSKNINVSGKMRFKTYSKNL